MNYDEELETVVLTIRGLDGGRGHDDGVEEDAGMSESRRQSRSQRRRGPVATAKAVALLVAHSAPLIG